MPADDPPRPYLPRAEAVANIQKYKKRVDIEFEIALQIDQLERVCIKPAPREYGGPEGPATKAALQRLEQGKASAKERKCHKQKELGDAAFKEGRYVDAVLHYKNVTDLDGEHPYEPECRNNQALALIKLERWSDVVRNYHHAVISYRAIHGVYDSSFVTKAYYRGAIAKKNLGMYEAAQFAFEQAQRVSPTDKVIQSELKSVKSILKNYRRQHGDDRLAEVRSRMRQFGRFGRSDEEVEILCDAGVMPWDEGVKHYLRAARGDLSSLEGAGIEAHLKKTEGRRRPFAAVQLSTRFFYDEVKKTVVTEKEARAAWPSSPSSSTSSSSSTSLVTKGTGPSLKDVSDKFMCRRCHSRKPGIMYKKCAGCLLAIYCSKECQRAHWHVHKAECENSGAHMYFCPGLTEADIVKYLRLWDSSHQSTLQKAWAWAVDAASLLPDLTPPMALLTKRALYVSLKYNARGTNPGTRFIAVYVDSIVIEGIASAERVKDQLRIFNEDAKKVGGIGAGIMLYTVDAYDGSRFGNTPSLAAPIYLQEGWMKVAKPTVPPKGWPRIVAAKLNGAEG